MDPRGCADPPPKPGYVEGVPCLLLLVKQGCTNAEGSTGVVYVGTRATTWPFADLTPRSQKRWQVAR